MTTKVYFATRKGKTVAFTTEEERDKYVRTTNYAGKAGEQTANYDQLRDIQSILYEKAEDAKKNVYYMVMINYQGAGAVPEYFNTKEEAQEFYDNNDYVDMPKRIMVDALTAYEIDGSIAERNERNCQNG